MLKRGEIRQTIRFRMLKVRYRFPKYNVFNDDFKCTHYSPTHEPQSPAPGEPRGLSKCPFTKTDGSVSLETTDDIL